MSFNTIKVEFGSQLRRLAFDSVSSSWTAVRSQLLTSYGLDSAQFDGYALHYLDDEGDLISVNSDTEFAEAMRCAKQKGKILKLILSKTNKPTAPQAHTVDTLNPNVSASSSTTASTSSSSNAINQPQQSEKAALLSAAVGIHSDVEDVKVADGAVDDVADQQVEDMDLPLSRRDLLSKSPTLSEASDSSFVSINAQSLRDDLDGKDELAVEGANDSELLSAVDDEVKEAVVPTVAATPSQPEFIASDRGVVQDVLKKLADDPIQLKSASPKAPSASTTNSITQTDEKQAVQEPKGDYSQDHKEETAAPSAMTVVSSGMTVKELRPSIEGIINEKLSGWLEEVLNSLENLQDREDEQMDRVQQLTAQIRAGLTSQHSLQRISDAISKSMMRAGVVKGKRLKPKKLKVQPLPMEDEEQKTKAAAPTPIVQTPTVKASASVSTPVAAPSNCCASSAVVVHRGITCDGCGMSPICGVRFHCISCDQITKVRQAGGFDLCESCEGRGIHREVDGKVHVMIKIKQPTKVIVDIEAPAGPVAGPQVYDVLRVNADGTRTPFYTAQPIAASAPVSSSSSVSKEEKCSDVASVAAAKVAELEQRIRSLEDMMKSHANRKAEKQAAKEQKRKDKEERKRMKQEATALAKAARMEARQKMKEEKLAAKRAAMDKTKAEAIAVKREEENSKQAEEKKDASEPPVKVENPPLTTPTAIVAPLATAAGAVTPIQSVPAEKAVNNTSTSAAASATAAGPASAPASAPAPAPAPVPFSFTLPQFPFSDMVNSITNTFSSATAPFAFGNQNNSKQPAASAPFLPSAPTQPSTLNPAAKSSNAASTVTASSSSSAAVPSIWAQPLPTNNARRTLADVRAPAFFPYMVQLRDLESMGFDVDKSIHALRYYGGDIQKAINSMI